MIASEGDTQPSRRSLEAEHVRGQLLVASLDLGGLRSASAVRAAGALLTARAGRSRQIFESKVVIDALHQADAGLAFGAGFTPVEVRTGLFSGLAGTVFRRCAGRRSGTGLALPYPR